MASRKIEVQIIGDASSLQRSLGVAQSSVAKFGSSMQRTGATLSRNLTVPLVAAGVVAGKFALDFQKQMEMVHTQAGASTAEVEKMSKALLTLAPEVATGPTDLAKALYHVESVGVRGAAALNVLKQAALGAKVGGADLEDTTNALSAAWVSGIQGAGNMRQAMAQLNAIVGVGNMRMGDLAAAMSSGILPAAKTFGLSLRSVGAALATLTDAGVPAQEAATRLRMTFSLLGAPSAKAQKMLKTVGISALGLADAMRGPNGLDAALTMLKTHLDGMTKSQQAAFLSGAFGGGRSSATILTLIGNLGRLGSKYDQIGKNAGKFGAAVAATQETAAFKVDKAVAQLEASAISLGAVILPVFAEIASKVGEVTTAFSGLSPGAKSAIVTVGEFAAVLGPMYLVVGKLVSGIAGLSAAYSALAGAETLAQAAATPFGVGLIAIGVAAAGAAIYFAAQTTSVDALGAAYADATGNLKAYKALLDGMKDSSHSVTEAEHNHTAAVHDVQAAQKAYNQTVKEYGKSSLQAKQALDQLHSAEDSEYNTVAALDKARRQHHDKIVQQQKDYKKLTDTVNRLNQASQSEQQHLLDQQKHFRMLHGTMVPDQQVLKSLATLTDNYAAKSGKAALALETFAGKIQKSNPQVAAAARKQAGLALASEVLAQKINGIPTQHQIHVYYRQNMAALTEQARILAGEISSIPSVKTVSIRFLQGHGTPGARAAGGPVYAGRPYIVGEKRPELFVPNQNGTIIPSVPSSGTPTATMGQPVAMMAGQRGQFVRVLIPDGELAKLDGARAARMSRR